MSKKITTFSKNLLSLKVQLETLFEDVGGEDVIKLLDNLSSLSQLERSVAIKMMTKVCSRLAQRENRSFTRDEEKMRELEDLLVNDIAEELKAKELSAKISNKLSLVHGGKDPISEASSRLQKKESRTQVSSKILEFKPVLN